MNLNIFNGVLSNPFMRGEGGRSRKKDTAKYEYDVVIVGSGISGLYAAYKIKKHSPHLSVQILEKHKKIWVGGRTGNETFYGTEVVTGAGIGRKHDSLLRKLMRELHFDLEEFKVTPYFSHNFTPVDINRTMDMLRREYQKSILPTKQTITFKRFAKPFLGDDVYERFLLTSGYTDYENEDAHDTLYNYGMEDNACCLAAFRVHWRKLVLALVSVIGESHFHFSTNVTTLSRTEDAIHPILIETENGRKYGCKQVILATTITSLRNLLPNPIYKEIQGQPFLRTYGKFSKQSIPIIKEYVRGYTCVPGPLQKIIPMNPEDGIYMIAYNDNANAVKMKSYGENTELNRDYYCRLFEKSLGIPLGRLHLIGIRSYYWAVGTHYYKPLNTDKYKDRDEFIADAQHPEDGVLVVGEVVSKNQGWVEGALKSVDAVVTSIIPTKRRRRFSG
jgi:glycine/D-amino acid oxidase-like deaminating enzyme